MFPEIKRLLFIPRKLTHCTRGMLIGYVDFGHQLRTFVVHLNSQLKSVNGNCTSSAPTKWLSCGNAGFFFPFLVLWPAKACSPVSVSQSCFPIWSYVILRKSLGRLRNEPPLTQAQAFRKNPHANTFPNIHTLISAYIHAYPAQKKHTPPYAKNTTRAHVRSLAADGRGV